MYRFLRSPRWIAAAVVVATLAAGFVALGGWQLDRLEERRIENRVRAARMAAEPVALRSLLDAVDESSLDSLEYRAVTATGRYRRTEEVLVRNRTNDAGTAGFWLLTPLELGDGTVVIVNRGWIPLRFETPPVDEFPPPGGVVTVLGHLRLDEDRPRFGPVDPPGPQTVLSRVDLDRLAELVSGPLAPVWIQRAAPDADAVPIVLDLPDVGDEGPHLGYAIQWFAFATIVVVGFGLLARRAARTGGGRA